jgi:hypothetical protein
MNEAFEAFGLPSWENCAAMLTSGTLTWTNMSRYLFTGNGDALHSVFTSLNASAGLKS